MQAIKPLIENIKTIFKGVAQFVKGVFTGDWKGALNGLKTIASGALSGLVNPTAPNATFTTGTMIFIAFLIAPAIKLNAAPATALNAVMTAPAALQVLLTFLPKIFAIMVASALTTFPIALNTVLNIVFNPFMILPTRVLILLIVALNFFISTPHLVSTFLIAFPKAVKILFTIFRFLKELTAPFTVLAISLNGAFMMFTKPDNAPLAMVFSPFSAPFHSAVMQKPP